MKSKIEIVIGEAPIDVLVLGEFATWVIKSVIGCLLVRQTVYQRTPLRNKIRPRPLAMLEVGPVRAEGMDHRRDVLRSKLEPE